MGRVAKYKKVTLEQRKVIEASLLKGKTLNEISEEIGIHHSTLSREIQRNKTGVLYCAERAHEKFREREKKTIAKAQKSRRESFSQLKQRIKELEELVIAISASQSTSHKTSCVADSEHNSS